MTDRPIIFSAPMVRALLDGRKTHTRLALSMSPLTAPYTPGDRLWVREAWRTRVTVDDLKPSEMTPFDLPLWFEADRDRPEYGKRTDFGRYRHARFMPRWASRLTLTVTDAPGQEVGDVIGFDVHRCNIDQMPKEPDA